MSTPNGNGGKPRTVAPDELVAPVQVATIVGAAPRQPDGIARVVVRIESATGSHVIVIDADHADRLAGALRQSAGVARSGITLARDLPKEPR